MPTAPPELLVSVGEASGDLLAAELLDELRRIRPGVRSVGITGPRLASTGTRSIVDAGSLAVVGLAEALGAVPAGLRALRRVRAELDGGGVSLALLVDAPDLNLPIARMAAARGIPVVYYVSPQVWAWRRGRLRTLARRVDRMLTLLPFEPPLYEAEGVPVTHVGHPLVDRVAPLRGEDDGEREPLVALLPGSRRGEVDALWPAFVDAARAVAQASGGVRFEGVVAPGIDDARLPVPPDLPVRLRHGPAAETLVRARCALVASGTATLESALCGTPHVVAYRVHPLTWFAGRALVRGVDHVALSNLVAGHEVAPERLQRLDADALAAPLIRWLDDDDAWSASRAELDRVRARAGEPGAAARAAAAVDAELARPPEDRPGPRLPTRRELALVGALAAVAAVVRLALGLLHPLHPDEAYFWRWSLDPAWGYFDQPPLVAWLIGAARVPLGESVAAVRAVSAVCSAGALALVYAAAREHLGPARAAAAAGLLLATPLVAVGGLVTTPDAPLSLAWAATLYAATRAFAPRLGRPPPASRWLAPWLALAVLVALGVLAKLTMVLAIAGIGLMWLALPRPRPWRAPALASLAAAALLTPWMVWNLRHGLAPFGWELSHGLHPHGGNPLARAAAFVGGQLGVVGPLWLLAALWAWARGLGRGASAAQRTWTALSLPVFAAFGAASLLAPSAANWPAMAYPGAACLIAATASRRALAWVGGSSAVLSLVAAVHLVHPLAPLPPRADPLRDTVGYDELAAQVELQLASMPPQTTVFASRYQDAAALAFALHDDPRRVADRAGRGRPNQWDLWPEPAAEPALFVSLNPAAGMACAPVAEHEVRYRGEVVRRYVMYPCAPPQDADAWRRPGTW